MWEVVVLRYIKTKYWWVTALQPMGLFTVVLAIDRVKANVKIHVVLEESQEVLLSWDNH